MHYHSKRIVFLWFIPLVFWFLACGGREEPRILATVNGTSITADAFVSEMIRRGGQIPGQMTSTEQKTALLEEMIEFEVLVASARKAGYDKDPEVIAGIKRLLVSKFRRDQLDARLSATTVSDEEIQNYFRTHIDQYTTAEMVRAAIIHIKLPSQASRTTRKKLEARAAKVFEEARAEPSSPRNFGALAVRYSDDRTTKYRGGDTGWLARGKTGNKWDSAVVEVMFGLNKPGMISPIIETGNGFYIVKLMDKKPATPRPLAQVKAAIRHRLLQDKKRAISEKWYAALKDKTRIEIDRTLLETIQPPGDVASKSAQPEKPPALPRG
jgi:parvulin-like peptidyl-prolyl isomerase